MRKSEKKILIISLTVGITLFLIFVFLINFYLYKKFFYIEKGEVIAKVNGSVIYKNEITPRLEYMSLLEEKEIKFEELDKEAQKAILLEAYVDDFILNKFYQKHFNKERIDMLVSEYKKKVVREEYFKTFIINNIKDEDLVNKYNDLIKNAKEKEERKISHILVESEEEAEIIRRNILRNKNFEYQANKYSLDKATAVYGGDLGYLLKEEIQLEEFASIAFILKKDEISKPIKTSEGWHIIKVEDIRQTEIKPFEEVKDFIKDLYEEELVNNYIKTIIKDYEPVLIKK